MNRPNPSMPEYETIGPYKVLGILGQGGMGTVYKASHAKTNELVAVKVIAAAMAQHQRFRRRFDAEIQTLVKLKHPGIVQLIGFGEEKGLLFYSMEYVEGSNLQQVLKKEGRLPWQRVVDIAIEISAALKHAHDFGVIHRDLKPANLMIQTDGKVKLTDFGIAKLFGAADSTVEGSVLGTADFMAPEQAEGKPVTVRSDLYALGSVCYAAITGRPPYQGKNIPEVLFNVRYGTYPRINSLAPDTPAELEILIDELLQREASRRPPTGLVVGNRLQALKIGLQKSPSIVITNPTANVSKLKELTSIDLDAAPSLVRELNVPTLSDSNSAGQIWPTAAGPAAGDLQSSDQNVTHRTSLANISNRSEVDAPHPAQQSNDAARFPFGASPHENTVAQSKHPSSLGLDADGTPTGQSVSPSVLLERPSGIDFMKNTSFTEVDDMVRTRSSTTFHTDETTVDKSHTTAIATLCILLVGCVGFVIYMLQKPSSNSLYAPIAQAIANSEDDEWLEAAPTASRFLELYPEDPRAEDAAAVLQEAELVRVVRQIQRRARRNNADQLEAIDQAFLEVLNAQQISSNESINKLNAFLTMFGTDPSSEQNKLLVLQANRMLKGLESSQLDVRSAAYKSLQKQMDWADANLTASARSNWYKAVIELFGQKSWASELVIRAQSSLSSPESASPDSE